MNNENVKLDYAQMEAAVKSINNDLAAMSEKLNTNIDLVSYTGDAADSIQRRLNELKNSLQSLNTPISAVLSKVNEITTAYKETESKIKSTLSGSGGDGASNSSDSRAPQNKSFAKF